MTDKRAWAMASKQELLYYISWANYQYFVDSGFIVGVGGMPHSPLRYMVKSDITGEQTELYAKQMYDKPFEAGIDCQKMQEKYGHVIITQKEYNEYMTLKYKARNGGE